MGLFFDENLRNCFLQAESGSPLVRREEDLSWRLIGLYLGGGMCSILFYGQNQARAENVF